jgi:hypothetical protein
VQNPVIAGVSRTQVRVGNAVFALAAILVIAFAARRASAYLETAGRTASADLANADR